jgi:hypothetical protein
MGKPSEIFRIAYSQCDQILGTEAWIKWMEIKIDSLHNMQEQVYGLIVGPENEKEITLTANDVQHGGDHYRNKKIQPWDFILENGIGFCEGSAIKYLSRWKEKEGIKDLRKAIHFIQKLIEVEEARSKTQ